MTREDRLVPNGVPRWIRIYDNGGKTFDRYTVVFTGRYKGRSGCDYLGMSDNPTHPQGFAQHGWSEHIIDRPSNKLLGKKISWEALPLACRQIVLTSYKNSWGLD